MEVDESVRRLIAGFRLLAQDPEGRKLLRINVKPEVFLAPTQAVVFEFTQPDYIVIFFTHFDDEPDQKVTFATTGTFAKLFTFSRRNGRSLKTSRSDILGRPRHSTAYTA